MKGAVSRAVPMFFWGVTHFCRRDVHVREQRFQEKQSLCHWRDGNKTPGEWYFIV
jgi:hypothetical protein